MMVGGFCRGDPAWSLVRWGGHTGPPLHRFDAMTLYVDHYHALGFQVIVQSFGAVFAADTAGFHAAEGKLVVAIVQRVDPNIAGLKLVDRLVSAEQIARPD